MTLEHLLPGRRARRRRPAPAADVRRPHPTASCGPTPTPPGSTPTTRAIPAAGPAAVAAAHAPSRVETVERLAAEGMLPAIYFMFSRSRCDQAVEQCLAAGLRLTDPAERDRDPRRSPRPRPRALADDDLDVLGYDQWLAGLEAGLRRAPRRAWCRR